AVDRDNHLLWHARRWRLEGEALRDAALALSGELSRRMFGPSARPELPATFGKSAWTPDPPPQDRHRRSVYVLAKRNLRFPPFDLPDMHTSCPRRLSTTTAPQALFLLNSELTLGRARQWADRLWASAGEDVEKQTAVASRFAWGRPAKADEVQLAIRFVERQA